MSELARVVLFVFLASIMISVGLQTTSREVLAALRSSRLLVRALLANLVIVPLLGLFVVWVFPLSPEVEIALLALAAAPGAPLSVEFTTKVREHVDVAAALQFILIVAALLVSPLLIWLMLPVDVPVLPPMGKVLRYVLLLLLLPLAVGLLLHERTPSVARWLRRPVRLIAALAFPAVILTTMGARSEAMRAVGGAAIGAMLVLIVLSMATGWLLGGPARGTRQVLAAATGMRNAALCLLLAYEASARTGVAVAVVAFAALMVPPSLALSLIEGRLRKRREAAAAEAT